MLKVRVIPTLLWKEFGLVKGVGFNSGRRVGPVLPAIKVYNKREVDELVLVDILANSVNEDLDYASVADFSQDCFVPFSVGGGIRNQAQVQRLLSAGADKVTINTAAFDNPELISAIASQHGVQCVVGSVDVRHTRNKSWMCFSHSGKTETGKDVRDHVRQLEANGAGEILITSIDRDGTMSGYDLELIETVVNAVKIPVIASGGAGCYQDMVDAVLKTGASAVAAASIFHFTQHTPSGAKDFMQAAGIPIRKNYVKK